MGWQFSHDKEFTSSRRIFPRTYHYLRLLVIETSKKNHFLLSRTQTLFTTIIRSVSGERGASDFLAVVILRFFEVKILTRVSGSSEKMANEGK